MKELWKGLKKKFSDWLHPNTFTVTIVLNRFEGLGTIERSALATDICITTFAQDVKEITIDWADGSITTAEVTDIYNLLVTR